jgi:multidrug efflux system membrane fusion protein
MPNPDHYFWPGQFVNVRLVLSVEKGVVLVPSEAVQSSQTGQFVYVVKPDQTVEFRPVTAKRALDGKTVVDGVKDKEVVVTDGHLRLVPGSKIQIKTSEKK